MIDDLESHDNNDICVVSWVTETEEGIEGLRIPGPDSHTVPITMSRHTDTHNRALGTMRTMNTIFATIWTSKVQM